MYIDFHNHLDFYNEETIKEAIEDINKNKIKTIACAMDIDSYLHNKEISKQSEYIIPTFGIHPSKAFENINKLDEIENYIVESPLVGEIGLDFHWVEDKKTYPYQIKVFEYFLKCAKKHNKYINIHTKGAEVEVLNLIKKYDISSQSIIHWYSGDKYTLEKLIDANCIFSASVNLEYSKNARDIIDLIPITKLVAETDGPTALEWINGVYGMPSEIKSVYKSISEIKKIDIQEYKLNCENILLDIIR